MNPTIQSGTHPDAESLTAFAEQSLSGAEREQILAHMAVCGRCREVVFLAQQAREAEPARQISVETGVAKGASRGWFGGWRWAWVPVAALAGFVGFAVMQHARRASLVQEVARNAQQAEALQGGTAANVANGSTMQPAAKKDEPRAMSADQRGTAAVKEEQANKDAGANVLDEKKSVEQKDQSNQTSSAMNASAGAAGGAMHGAFAARTKSSQVGGPMAQNQAQQQNYMQQNALVQAQAPANEMLNKPLPPAAAPPVGHPGATSESVEVQPSQQAAPSPARQMATVSVTAENLEVARDAVSKTKAAKAMLPSGLEAVSVATALQRTVAIDTAGGLFLSEDAGKHWQAVKTQWTGRAVLVRTPKAAADPGMLMKQQTPLFELRNDKLQTWLSLDGKTWTEQSLPEK